MREIKFRAWDSEKNKMLYIGKFPLYHEKDNGLHSGKEDKQGDWYNLPLMQFTGLTDKNGKDIYENDIVNFRANYTNKPCGYMNGVVKITSYELLLVVGDIEYNALEETDEFPYSKCEVLGNIYENPELL